MFEESRVVMYTVRQNILSMEHKGEAAGLNTFSSEEQEVVDPLCQRLISRALKEYAVLGRRSRVEV